MMKMDKAEYVEYGRRLIRESNKILVFSGAGLSTESGIPDFRSANGLWSKYDPSDFYFHKIITDTNARRKYWQMSSEMWEQMRDARPNRGHMMVKKLEDIDKLLCIVTQNIDNLHQKAGNSRDKIIEIHGTASSVSCLACKRSWPRDEIHNRVRAGDLPPACYGCGGILKPDTISFGQEMPQEKMTLAFEAARNTDLCIVLGSSLVVSPANEIPWEALKAGARLMIINREPTPLDEKAHVVLNMDIGDTLEELMKGL